MKYFLSTEYTRVSNGPGYLAKYIHDNSIISCVGYDVTNSNGNIRARIRFKKIFGYFGTSIDLWLAVRKELRIKPKLIINSSPLIWLFLFVYPAERLYLLINDYNAITTRLSISRRYEFRQWLIGRVEMVAANRRVNLIFNSYHTKRVFDTETNYIGSGTVIHKGIDISQYPVLVKKFTKADKINLLYLKSDISIGNLQILVSFLEQKGQDFHLHIVGPSANDFKRIAKGQNLPISFYGRLSTFDLVELCRQTIDVAILMSSKEALGIALIEMLAMGIPVVSSNVGGMKEVSKDGYYTVNLREISESELVYVFNDLSQVGLKVDLKEAAQYVRNKFSITKTVNEYLQL